VIARSVLGAVGRAVDWSLIHLLAAVSDRVEGRGADCYRRADALADMEAGRDHLEPGDLGSPEWLQDTIAMSERFAAETYKHFLPEPLAHGLSGECPAEGSSCGCGRSAAVTTPAADNTTTVDHLEAAWNYHKGAVGYAAMRAGGVEWFCEGCDWSGPTKQAHARHRFQVLADMKNATTRVQEQLGGTA